MKKMTGLFLAATLSISMFTGCGNTTTNETTNPQATVAETESQAAESQAAETEMMQAETDENEVAANQLFIDLTGSYQELWPVILDDAYTQTWVDDCAAIVGEENAQAAYEKLKSMVTADIYGEEAVEAYQNGGGAYFCGFTQDVATFEFDGAAKTIKGYDKDENELFSHTYHYVGMEEVRGLYEFESDDADAGEFTYFYLAPDTNETTYHIEFRYGKDADELATYDAGEYAYWLASGISTEYDEEMIDNCIQLFCEENLSE